MEGGAINAATLLPLNSAWVRIVGRRSVIHDENLTQGHFILEEEITVRSIRPSKWLSRLGASCGLAESITIDMANILSVLSIQFAIVPSNPLNTARWPQLTQ